MKNNKFNILYVLTAVSLLSLPIFAYQFDDMREMISQSVNNGLEDCAEDYVACANNAKANEKATLIKELQALDEEQQTELMTRAIKEKKTKAIEIFIEADFVLEPKALSFANPKTLKFLADKLPDSSKCSVVMDSIEADDEDDLTKALSLWTPSEFAEKCSAGRLLDLENYDTDSVHSLLSYVGNPDALHSYIFNVVPNKNEVKVSLLTSCVIALVQDGADCQGLCDFLIENGADVNQKAVEGYSVTVQELLDIYKEHDNQKVKIYW